MKNNRWLNGVLPAFLMHISIGSVYAFSLLVKPLAQYVGWAEWQIQIAFSLVILFLGLSAAFCGKLIEKNIRLSSIIGAVCFIGGLASTSFAILNKSLWQFYLSCGVFCGIGLGITYLTPCKTVMLYFKENKGLGMGFAVVGFGFASTIASPILTNLLDVFENNIENVFLSLALIYLVPMVLAVILLKKPNPYEKLDQQKFINFKHKDILKDKLFWIVWVMFFINIHCGLAIIGIDSPMLTELGASSILIALVISVMGLCNGGGRILFSSMADYFSRRAFVYLIIFGLSIVAVYSYIILPNIFTLGLLLCGISAFFGAGFSNISPLLIDRYGMINASKVHGLILSAWGIAGLTGNNMSVFIHELTGSYDLVYSALGVLYTIGFLLSVYLCFNYKKLE